MPELTRKRVNDRPTTWHVHYAGVRVGVIVERIGRSPLSVDQWEWHCGCYPGSNPGEQRYGTAINAVQESMNEIGRAIFALAVTAIVCIATYFIIRYLMAA